MAARYSVFLFIDAGNCERYLSQVKSILSRFPVEHYELECIDIDQHPERAEEFEIKSTPALVVLRDGAGRGGMGQYTFYNFDDREPILYALGKRLW